MPKPVSHRELLRRLRALGWNGPHSGGGHPYLRDAEGRKLTIPNAHGSDLDWTLVKRILRQAGIAPEDWEKAGME